MQFRAKGKLGQMLIDAINEPLIDYVYRDMSHNTIRFIPLKTSYIDRIRSSIEFGVHQLIESHYLSGLKPGLLFYKYRYFIHKVKLKDKMVLLNEHRDVSEYERSRLDLIRSLKRKRLFLDEDNNEWSLHEVIRYIHSNNLLLHNVFIRSDELYEMLRARMDTKNLLDSIFK